MIGFLVAGAFLFALLTGAVAYYRLRRRSTHSRLLFTLAVSSGSFLGIWILFIGAFLVALFEPWPLSLRQGPDTDYARSCFERHLGETPPPMIIGCFCREEWGCGGDSIYSIRFAFSDASQIETLVQRLELRRAEEYDRRVFRYLRGPSWWPTEADLFALPEAYSRNEIEYLWVDSTARIAYYQKGNF